MMFCVAAAKMGPCCALRVEHADDPEEQRKPDITNIVASPDGIDSLRISHCCPSDG